MTSLSAREIDDLEQEEVRIKLQKLQRESDQFIEVEQMVRVTLLESMRTLLAQSADFSIQIKEAQKRIEGQLATMEKAALEVSLAETQSLVQDLQQRKNDVDVEYERCRKECVERENYLRDNRGRRQEIDHQIHILHTIQAMSPFREISDMSV